MRFPRTDSYFAGRPVIDSPNEFRGGERAKPRDGRFHLRFFFVGEKETRQPFISPKHTFLPSRAISGARSRRRNSNACIWPGAVRYFYIDPSAREEELGQTDIATAATSPRISIVRRPFLIQYHARGQRYTYGQSGLRCMKSSRAGKSGL